MATKSHPLVGRKANIDFHSYGQSSYPTHKDAVRASVENTPNAGLFNYYGTTGVILDVEIGERSIWTNIEMPDGKIVKAWDGQFTLLPAEPEPNAWEFNTLRTHAGTPETLAALNKLGAEGWECFMADDINGTFFFKRRVVVEKKARKQKSEG